MDETSVGNWSDALLHLAEAVRLRPAELQFQEAFFNSQLALKKFDEAEAFLRANPAKDTANFLAAHKLGLLFALQGRTEDLNKLIASYRREVQSSDGTRAALAVAEFQASFLYAAGDFDALEKLLRNLKRVSPERFYALVELGRLPEAAEMIKAPHDSPPNIVNILSLCAAWKNAGNEVEAAACRDQAVQVLARGRIDEMLAAQFLKRDQPTPLDEIMDLPILPSEKALLLVVQAQRFPKNNAPLLAAARKLNALPQFPYHLLNRLTAPAGNGG
jgi:tetratricopeptide (TPR) repeat protein